MRMTVVVDNIESGNLCGEWGLCVYIEYNGKNILLDTGASGLFAKNAKALGVSVENVDAGVLSHAHFDHSDGMRDFFAINQNAVFFVREGSEENCYELDGENERYIGIAKDTLGDFKDRIRFVKGDFKLFDGVYLIPHKTEKLAEMGKREKMYVKKADGWHSDDFSHEQSLVFETEKGLVVFNSCSHGGAYNIVREISETFPDKKVYALIGGFHLYNKTAEEVKAFAEKIKELKIEYVCTGHCTGNEAYSVLKEYLGSNLHKLHVGLVAEF